MAKVTSASEPRGQSLPAPRPPGCPHPHLLLKPGSGARTLVPSTQVHEHFTRCLMGTADGTPPGTAAPPSQSSDHSLGVLLAPSHPPTCIPSVRKPCGSSRQSNSAGQSHSPSLRLRARPGTVSTQKRGPRRSPFTQGRAISLYVHRSSFTKRPGAAGAMECSRG